MSSVRGWQASALCAGLEPETFFPAQGENVPRYVKELCAACPVRLPCLEDALRDTWQEGYRGGMSPVERKRLKRRARKVAA